MDVIFCQMSHILRMNVRPVPLHFSWEKFSCAIQAHQWEKHSNGILKERMSWKLGSTDA